MGGTTYLDVEIASEVEVGIEREFLVVLFVILVGEIVHWDVVVFRFFKEGGRSRPGGEHRSSTFAISVWLRFDERLCCKNGELVNEARGE